MEDSTVRRSSRLHESSLKRPAPVYAQPINPIEEESWSDFEPAPKRAKQKDQVATLQQEENKVSLIVTLRVPQASAIATVQTSSKPKNTRSKPKGNAHPGEEIEDLRSPSQGVPSVWADTRAELVAALPYYNAYYSGASAMTDNVKGLLLDGFCGDRSYMDEQIVITRAGGGREQNESGKSIQTKNQENTNASIRAFYNNMTRNIPLQIIVGSRNPTCPSKIPHRYCVMGSFQVTYIWTEKCDGHIVYKYKFQKTDLGRRSWWTPRGTQYSPGTSETKALEKTCNGCRKPSRQVYEESWICLNAECGHFWLIGGKSATEFALSFAKDFLREREERTRLQPPFPIIPKPVSNLEAADAFRILSYSRLSWAGAVCEKCGRCNQRRLWKLWKCLGEGCNWEYTPPREIVPPAALMGSQIHGFGGHALSDDVVKDLVTLTTKVHGFFYIHEYKLSHHDLKITHFHANEPLNGTPGGADDIFRGLQEADLGLQRLPMASGQVSGQVTNHFVKNYGLPYEYIVKHPEMSTGFADAPAEIREVMRKLIWVGQKGLDDGSNVTLNECLAVGYFDNGSMSYHDDGEDTLGPNVVAWSLGGPADMHFRMKEKYFTGFTGDKRQNYHPEFPLLPGCGMLKERQELNDLAGTITPEDLSARAREKLKKCPRHARDFLVMKLRHGDFISMHGAPMQLYYEHQVNAKNGLRFALTGRFVIPEKIDQDQHWKGDLHLDPSQVYDGELKAFKEWQDEQERVLDEAANRESQV